MIGVCLLAFLCGMFLGYVSIRAIGWLVVVVVLGVGQVGAATYYCYFALTNDTGASHSYTVQQKYNGAWSGWLGPTSLGSNGKYPTSSSYQKDGRYYTQYTSTFANDGVRVAWDGGSWTELLSSDTTQAIASNSKVQVFYASGGGSTTNICSASVTFYNSEPPPYAQHWVVRWFDSHGDSPHQLWDGYVAQGGSMTINAAYDQGTGHCPGTLMASGDRIGFDSPTNVVANTSDGTRGLSDPGNQSDNPNSDSPLDPNSTNNASGKDMQALLAELKKVAKENTQRGTTNVLGRIEGAIVSGNAKLDVANGHLGALRELGQAQTNQLGRLESALNGQTNLLGSINTNVTKVNEQLDALTNQVAQLLGPYRDYTNWMATNGWGGASNSVGLDAAYMSNQVVAGISGKASGIYDLSNSVLAVANDQDRDVWLFPVRTNLAGAWGTIDMNPLHSKAAGIFPWLRLGLKFWIQIVVFLYMVRRIEEEYIRLLHTPGSGMGKQNIMVGMVFWAKSNMVFTTVLLATVVFSTGALDTFLVQTGSWLANPFSESGLAVAGEAATYLRAGFEVIEAMIPFTMIMTVVVLVFAFDLALTGHIVFVSRITRALAE